LRRAGRAQFSLLGNSDASLARGIWVKAVTGGNIQAGSAFLAERPERLFERPQASSALRDW
jgi:hypothetical protein